MLQDLGIVSSKAILLNVIHLDILRKRLHGRAQHHMNLSLKVSGIVLNEVISKISVSVSSGGNHGSTAIRTMELREYEGEYPGAGYL